MTKPIRWGILGAARFAREQMAPAIHEAEGAELYALATSDPAKADGFRAFCPALKVLRDYAALLADPEVDAVYIPLPNHLHVEWTKKALEAGKHVLCEKPIALRASEIDALIDLRDRTGLLAAEAYMIVHHPQWQKARELVRNGVIGDLRHADVAFSYDNSADVSNIRNRSDTGGGSIPDIGVYAYGCIRYVSGQEPDDLRAAIAYDNGVDTFAHVSGRFPGFTFAAMTSMRLPNRQEVVFQGTKGLIRLPAPFNANLFGEPRVDLHLGDQTVTSYRYPASKQYKLQVEAFGRSVRNGEPYPWTLENARGTQAMIDRIFAADPSL